VAGCGWATVAVGCQLGSQLGYRPPANPPDVAAAEGLRGSTTSRFTVRNAFPGLPQGWTCAGRGGQWDCRQESGFCRVWCYLWDGIGTPPFLGIRGMAACPWKVVMVDCECLVGPVVVVVLPDEIDIVNADYVGERLAVAIVPGVAVVIVDLTVTVFL